ncbi:MAG: hypothetical protein WC712_01745 [Candidatus Brocadiia bacterium]
MGIRVSKQHLLWQFPAAVLVVAAAVVMILLWMTSPPSVYRLWSGTVHIRTHVLVPEGTILKIERGATLVFGRKGDLELRGGIECVGDPAKPVNVVAVADSADPNSNPGNVLTFGSPARLENWHFSGGTRRGAFVCACADMEIADCSFADVATDFAFCAYTRQQGRLAELKFTNSEFSFSEGRKGGAALSLYSGEFPLAVEVTGCRFVTKNKGSVVFWVKSMDHSFHEPCPGSVLKFVGNSVSGYEALGYAISESQEIVGNKIEAIVRDVRGSMGFLTGDKIRFSNNAIAIGSGSGASTRDAAAYTLTLDGKETIVENDSILNKSDREVEMQLHASQVRWCRLESLCLVFQGKNTVEDCIMDKVSRMDCGPVHYEDEIKVPLLAAQTSLSITRCAMSGNALTVRVPNTAIKSCSLGELKNLRCTWPYEGNQVAFDGCFLPALQAVTDTGCPASFFGCISDGGLQRPGLRTASPEDALGFLEIERRIMLHFEIARKEGERR